MTDQDTAHCCSEADGGTDPVRAGAGRYSCPMHPQVEAAEPGDCPRCGMALEAEPPVVVAAPQWTCPMHPQIQSDAPGDCPICGMALEASAAADEAGNPELADMTRRFVISAALALPLLVLSMGDMLPGAPVSRWVGHGLRVWLELALATPVCVWAAWPFYQRALKSITNRSLNMFTLIGLGVAVSFGYSLIATISPGLFPQAFRGMDGAVAVYFEAGAVIVTLILLGQVLELRARSRTGAAIRQLLDLAPKTAYRLDEDGRETEVPLRAVQVGDRLRLRPGEAVPVDGQVLDGHSSVDQALVTGEPLAVERRAGDALIGGTVNGRGTLLMRADKVGADTLLAQIVAQVARAQRSRAPVQALADQVAAWFVPAVMAAAILAFVAWSLLGPDPRMAHALLAAVSVLIIACPCALGLATPMSVMVAMGRGATMGLLFRNAEAIEALAAVDTLVLDKTGTLTAGRPALVTVEPAQGIAEDELLGAVAAVEQPSEHPLAGALLAGAAQRGVRVSAVQDFESLTGLGVRGQFDGRAVAVGNQRLLDELGVGAPEAIDRAGALRAAGQSVMFVVIDGRYAGLVGVADPLRDSAAEALAALRATGLRIVMLTGDARRTAQAVAAQLKIDEVHADVLPGDKARVIRELQAGGRRVAMAGDGINDAPALAQADVGIAMGSGTDIAKESASVTLVRGDLRGIVRARRLSRATMRNIRQNLFFAFAYNSAGVPLAAGLFYPLFGWLLSPMLAAAAMSLSSVCVIGNALRLRRQGLD